MDNRSFQSGAAASAPIAPASPSSGYPTNGNPSTGTPATLPGAYWFHQIGEEIRAVIAGASLSPAAGTLNQLYTAITTLIANSAGAVASAAEAQGWSLNTKTITPGRLFDSFQGTNHSLTANGYQKLPGGLIIQWMTATESTGAANFRSFPMAFPNAAFAAFGGAIDPTIAGVKITSLSASGCVFMSGDTYGDGHTAYIFAIGY